ncbi:tRNA lysidine(34) synthetase TilS [Candidatus Aerophobetes bacterium]|nr:tRNA lysidine(34) synthetase TilS [Candidatus Aerophobetes bacterium]
MVNDSLLKKVDSTICSFNMLSKEDKVVVGISGGPDSAVLLHLLFRLKEKYNLRLWAAHLNHCIRGKEAEEDERWCGLFTREFEIPLICDAIDVPVLAREQRLGLEAVARKVRYNFLEHVASKVGADKIAVGHTASDQVETVLMRLIRGSGVDGLAGIPPVRGKIIRPLIRTFRWEIEDYCKRHNIVPRRDSSNKDTSFFRNSVRSKLIPYLRDDYNPRLMEVLSRSAELLRVDKEFLDAITEKVKGRVIRRKSGREIVVSIRALSKLHLCLQRRIIRHFLRELKGDLEGIEYSHIEQILSLKDKDGTKLTFLPGEIKVWQEYGELIFRKGDERSPYFFSYLNVPGTTRVSEINMVFETKILAEGPVRFVESPYEAFLDLDKIQGSLYLRPRKKGDRFVPLGMKGEKKLKDFFIDLKVPRLKRDRIPVLFNKDKIVWVVGYRIDERFKVDKTTKKILNIKALFYDA